MKERAAIAAILGGLAIVVVLAVVLLQFGRYDSPPSLEDDPNPAIPGELLWLDNNHCLVRAAASGAARESGYCVGQFVGQLTWVDADKVAWADYSAGTQQWTVLDWTTEEVRRTGVSAIEKGPIPYQPSVKGESVQVEQGGKVYVLSGGDRTLVHDFDTGDNWPQFAGWAPDGEWMLFSYWRPRGEDGAELWILSRDGKIAGTIAKKAQTPFASWRIDGVGISPPFADLEKLK